jgi:alkanesulfonate monooxygenase SsuD/methylene tetrahydromethanopterin reductase-like flavin-dependent oxidoreductase (luciferase family)
MREFLCAPTRSEAEDRYAEGLLATYRYYWHNKAFNADLEPWVNDITEPGGITFDRVSQDRIIFGTPDDCIGQVEQWVAATGAEHIQLTIPGPGGEAQLDAIRYAGKHVVPGLKRLAGG